MLTKMLPFDDDPGVGMMVNIAHYKTDIQQQIQDRYWVDYNSDLLYEVGISDVG